MNPIASLIIPTHNRSASLFKMLETLQQQTFPLNSFDVIIAADGCRDNTMEMVSNYKPNFKMSVCELPGLGAAAARNKGASLAAGRYLVFVDDDMELSLNFISEHLASHTGERSVVIGYSPFKMESKAGLQRMVLREWWEEKFQKMRKPDHRFKYDDLTSGNFSISSELFKKVNGFNTSLLCREDYELGYRLLKAGAQFYFAYKAKAFHRDEATDLRRSLQRKKSEGIADVQIKKMHADFVNREAIYFLSQSSFRKSILVKAIQYGPFLCDALASGGATLMGYLETLKMHSSWLRMNYRLHQYWYFRGLLLTVPPSEDLYLAITNPETAVQDDQKIVIDLQNGFKTAEEELDRSGALAIEIYYGNKFIGLINHDTGAEPLKGRHLRKLVKDHFSEKLTDLVYPSTLFR